MTAESTQRADFEISLANPELEGVVFRAAADETVLDAAERSGLVLPFGCRTGGCITCAAHLVSGELDQEHALGLTESMLNAGYVLLCVGRPRADTVLRVGVASPFSGLYRSEPPAGSPYTPRNLKGFRGRDS